MNEHKVNQTQYPPNWDNAKSKLIIEVKSIVNPSESIVKVTKAIKNIFPQLEVQFNEEKFLIGSSTEETILFHFCDLVFNQKILDVARKCALQGSLPESELGEKTKTILLLNKQVAYKDKVSFSEENESPLGPIQITIETKELDLFIDSYFPKYEWFK